MRIILSPAVIHDMHLEQMDVKTTFQYGELQEEIKMAQLEGFIDYKKLDYLCLLKKSLYDLKQSSKQ